MGLTAIARATLGAAVKTATGRRSKWAVLAVGVVLAGLAGPLASKLVPLEKNSPSSFLPSGAASTEVLDYQEAHGAGITPAVVVYERPGGLRPADKAVVRQARVSLDAALPRLAGAGAPGPVEFFEQRQGGLVLRAHPGYDRRPGAGQRRQGHTWHRVEPRGAGRDRTRTK